MLVQRGVTRWTTYRVAPTWQHRDEAGLAREIAGGGLARTPITPALSEVIDLFDEHAELSRAQIERLLNIKKQATIQRLRRLQQLGLLRRTTAPRSKNATYKKAT